ncbi:MAG: NAD(P)-dependent oxidoreductase [Cupriavidus sp.]|nr:NAD(P)-dependent oxidoreductase [Cupriavidus sp.]
MTARVVVTGAAGLIGAHASRDLRRQGFEVVDVLRGPATASDGADQQVVVDLSAPGAAEELRALLPVSTLVHCAALLPTVFEGGDSLRVAEINRAIDQAVIDFCATNGVRLVYCSGTAVYGILHDATRVTEAHALAPPEGYIAEKVWAEREIMARVPSYAILRICAPYGPGQRARTVLRIFVERAVLGQTIGFFGSGTREQDFLHVDDAAALISLAAARREVTGIFNASGGRPLTMRELGLLVSRVVSNGTVEVSGVDQADPQDGVRARFDLTQAREHLGWRPEIPLETGIADLARALREEVHASRAYL